MLEARAGNLASGVPEFHVPYSTCSCNLAIGNVGLLHGQPQQLRPSSQMRWHALSQGVFASKHASKGILLPAQAMRA